MCKLTSCVLRLLVVVAVAFTTGAQAQDCTKPGSTFTQDALAQDSDLPLSLMQVAAKQVKAIAMRNNKTQHANQTNQSLVHVVAIPKLDTAKIPISRTWGLDTLYAFYIALAILIGVVIGNFYVEKTLHKDIKNKQQKPQLKLPVDHLITPSKLNSELEKNQLAKYTRAKQNGNDFVKGLPTSFPSQTSSPKLSEHLSPADATKSAQHSIKEKAQGAGEALEPKLLLPLRETWYAVAIEKFLKADGSFDILRINGHPSLRASVSHSAGDGSVLDLFCCNAGQGSTDKPKHLIRATVSDLKDIEPGSDKARGTPLLLTSPGGEDLGELRSSSSWSFELARRGETKVLLMMDDAGQLQISRAGGSSLACVSCVAGHLSICINAGADTGLIVCLVLAVVLLGGAAEHLLPKSESLRGSNHGAPLS